MAIAEPEVQKPAPAPLPRTRVRTVWGRMTPLDTFRFATRALRDNWMRSLLTMLGIIIGVAAVVAAVAVGQGGAKNITNSVGQLGNNLLYIIPANPKYGPGQPEGMTQSLKPGDADAIRSSLKNTVFRVSAGVRGSVLVRHGNKNWRTILNGGDPDYYAVNNHFTEKGRQLNQADETTKARNVVLGKTVVENLFGDKDANVVGQEILLNRTRGIL